MKNIISIFTILIIIYISIWSYSYAVETTNLPYSDNTDYALYKERVKNICEQYKTKKELIKIDDKFVEIQESYDLNEIVDNHVDNMNNIYKCALLSAQKKSLLLIKNDLTKKNPILQENVWKKIDNKILKVEMSTKSLKCNNSDDKSSIIKLNVLQQSTYETCKYLSYLEYIKEHNNKLAWFLGQKKDKYSISEVTYLYKQNIYAIDQEIEHTYKVFPMAFHALTEYENNISIHFLLELIKDDYIILREKLHEVINPINQVVYKISNAMRK